MRQSGGVADDYEDPTTVRMREVTIGTPEKADIVLVEHDPAWAARFDQERTRIVAALGNRARAVEHVGSTSVSRLAAKPIIDICLTVDDSADEPAYVPALEGAGYQLRIREPNWFEHRMLRMPEHDVHLHVFSVGCDEVTRMVAFRDWLRSNPADRELYESTKRDLARRDWPTGQHYADAKTEVVAEIMARATAG
jgi:GrpB-like predicted nucleotidyltransferase (UPF0157 family)